MYKLAVAFLCIAVAVAQDLDSILLGIYGPDMNTNMIHKNSEEINTGGASTDYAQPIVMQMLRRKRSGGESCNIRGHEGRCVRYNLCEHSKIMATSETYISHERCESTIELCCLY